MKIVFIEDIDRDVKNWQSSLASQSSYVSDPKKYLPKDVSQEKLNDAKYLKEYLYKKYYQLGKVLEFRDWLIRNTNSSEIQSDLEKLVGRTFKFEEIDAYITIFGLGRYSIEANLFYVIYRSPERDRTMRISNIYHELMHFLFHAYYWEECQKADLSESQIHDFKESLTVLLNPILEKRGLPLDQGYPKHQELRAKLKELWEEKNWKFEDFLKEVLTLKLVSFVGSSNETQKHE